MICLWSEGDACLHSHLNEAKHKNVLCPWFSFWDKHGSLRFCPLLLLRNAVLYFRLAFLNAFHCAWDPSFGRSRWNNVVRRDKVSTCRSKFNFLNYLVIFRHYLTGNGKVSCILATISDWFPNINRASDISQKKKIKFHGIFGDNIAEKSVDFAGIFRANLAGKQSVKKRRNLWLFSGQISQQIDRFCADQTSVFNVFLTEVIICSFNNNTF